MVPYANEETINISFIATQICQNTIHKWKIGNLQIQDDLGNNSFTIEKFELRYILSVWRRKCHIQNDHV
jgi:hypothetical protein